VKSIFYLVFLLLSFSAQSECEKMSFSSVDTDYEGVNYGLSDVIVTSKGRTFFYDFPLEKCKSNKVFIINGDKAVSYASYNGFQYINYLDRNGIVHAGWVKSPRISKDSISTDKLNVREGDFFVDFNGTEIHIDNSYSDIAWLFDNLTEIDNGNKHIDLFRTINGVDYKFYQHDFDPIYIESSNLNYDKIKRDFDDYRITRITLKSDIGFSSRGIFVGSKMLNVLKVYGKPSAIQDGDLIYYYDNKSIRFIGSETVKQIDISINPV